MVIGKVTWCDKAVGEPLHLAHLESGHQRTLAAADRDFQATIKRLSKIWGGRNVLLKVQLKNENRVIRHTTLRYEALVKEELVVKKVGRGWVKESEWLDEVKDLKLTKGTLLKYSRIESCGNSTD